MQNISEKLYSAAQVREMDRMAIEDYAIPGIDLMRRAGFAVFEKIQHYYADVSTLVVFCGAGNNAGDGYVIAKLALFAGIKTIVYAVSEVDKLSGDARLAYQDFMQAGGHISDFYSEKSITDGIIVDALLGTGLSRRVDGKFAEAIELINSGHSPVFAVDIPSGLNADTGFVMGCAVKADYTVSFIGQKRGMFTGLAAEYCGQIIFSTLDIPYAIYHNMASTAKLMQQPVFQPRHRSAHKGYYGHVLLIGGDSGYSGAIRLAAEAALYTGAGLVSVATRAEHANTINIQRPELMCHGIVNADDLQPLIEQASMVVIGPGLGQSDWAKTLFNAVVKSDKPLLLDADALNLLARQTLKRADWILTPHPGEAARLLEITNAEINYDRYTALFKLHKKYAGVVVLKGAGSLVHNGQQTILSATGNPGMASGGMGDVLSGIIAALAAQKQSLMQAACNGVYIHGEAADLAAAELGERGLLAADILPYIRKLINR